MTALASAGPVGERCLSMNPLPPGVILEVAHAAGLELRGSAEKRTLRCPFHPDHRPSAFVSVERNLFSCSVCGSLSAKRFGGRLGVPWPPVFLARERAFLRPTPVPREAPRFTGSDAARIWTIATERARRADPDEADALAYRYLANRGLAATWELAAYGLLAEGMNLPCACRAHTSAGCPKAWARSGYLVVAPLHDVQTGDLVSLQARNVGDRKPKVAAPSGARLAGTAFASAAGLTLLQGEGPPGPVILGEGLTDYLALSIVATCAVLAAPGAPVAPSVVAPWVTGRAVLVALDADEAGERAAQRVAAEVWRHGGRPLRLRWPEGAKDAADVLARYGVDALGEALDEAETRTQRGGRS